MKKLFALLLTLSLIFFSTSLEAQKVFTGSIEYSVSYNGNNIDPMVKQFLPYSFFVTYGYNMMKIVELSTQGNQSIIIDGDNNMTYVLIEIMGQKFIIKEPINPTDSCSKMGTRTEKTDITKNIAGYTCTRENTYTVVGDVSDTSYVYICKELVNPINEYSGITFTNHNEAEGIALENSVNISQMNISMIITATKIDRHKVKKSFFDIPSGYKEISKEELQNMGGDM